MPVHDEVGEHGGDDELPVTRNDFDATYLLMRTVNPSAPTTPEGQCRGRNQGQHDENENPFEGRRQHRHPHGQRAKLKGDESDCGCDHKYPLHAGFPFEGEKSESPADR